MEKILITGATGNVGMQVIEQLLHFGTQHELLAGVREPATATHLRDAYPSLQLVKFDFEDPTTFAEALEGVACVFLLRPPHISKVQEVFMPLISAMKKAGIRRIVFLSVQGAGVSKIIPHSRIESLISEHGFNYIFIRPGYFMQNLTTILLPDIKLKRKIILPANNAAFNWVDVKNVAEVAAILLENFDVYRNCAVDVTGSERASFYVVEKLISGLGDMPVSYESVNPIQFYRLKSKENMAPGMIMVMIMLHYLPRFLAEPPLSDFYEKLTGKKPTSLREFIEREREKLNP